MWENKCIESIVIAVTIMAQKVPVERMLLYFVLGKLRLLLGKYVFLNKRFIFIDLKQQNFNIARRISMTWDNRNKNQKAWILWEILSTFCVSRLHVLSSEYPKFVITNTDVHIHTRVGTLIVATIYLQLIQNTRRYMFRSFTVLQCSHQLCVQPVASDVEVVGYL